ncbi:carbon-nitrogen hydrolase family protein [Mariniphaga sediminis]|nr:carbon-nitrogen hydrolase family protein [Mariniphaga sediminis]
MKKRMSFKMYLSKVLFQFLLFVTITTSLDASNYVTVATIGGRPSSVDRTQEMQVTVEKVIKFWDVRLKKVLPNKPDLVVLPEACDVPMGLTRTEKDNYYQTRKNQILDYFASVAKENRCYILYSTIRQQDADGVRRNSGILLDREGKIAGIYDKNYPTIGEMEAGIKAGDDAAVLECDFGRLACAICFDLNFDELRQKYEKMDPDIIVFPSMYHGGLVQSNWAYSCRSFFVSSCGFTTLPSEVRNPLGEIVASSTNYFHYAVTTINLDSRLVHLDYNWDKLSAVKEKYGRAVTITDPGKLGAVLITSEHESVSVNQMIKEFDIELLDDYFNRSRTFRSNRLGMDAESVP